MGVTVRLFAAAREAAGCGELVVEHGTVAVVVDRVVDLAPAGSRDRLSAVLGVSSLLLDGVRHSPGAAAAVPDGSVVDVLPPFAGG